MSATEIHSRPEPAHEGRNEPGITGLVGKLATDISDLMRGEMYLARAEIKSSVNDVKKAVISIAGGVVVLLAGLPILLTSLAYGITALTGLALGLSFLIVGLVASIVGAIMLKSAASKLSAENLAPSRTAASLDKDRHLIQEKTQ